MKAKVDVCRIGYGNVTLDVEIPDKKLFKTDKLGSKRKLTPRQVEKLFAEAAEDAAGSESFSEHTSEYEAQAVMLEDGK
jgi:hypothetical protein